MDVGVSTVIFATQTCVGKPWLFHVDHNGGEEDNVKGSESVKDRAQLPPCRKPPA